MKYILLTLFMILSTTKYETQKYDLVFSEDDFEIRFFFGLMYTFNRLLAQYLFLLDKNHSLYRELSYYNFSFQFNF